MGFSRRAAIAAAAALAAGALACAAPPGGAWAQAFPSRTITLVVPYPAGGPVDVVARLIAQEAGTELGQSIIVENRAGASGIVGRRRWPAPSRTATLWCWAPTRPTPRTRA